MKVLLPIIFTILEVKIDRLKIGSFQKNSGQLSQIVFGVLEGPFPSNTWGTGFIGSGSKGGKIN
jgi:hypothetical protein